MDHKNVVEYDIMVEMEQENIGINQYAQNVVPPAENVFYPPEVKAGIGKSKTLILLAVAALWYSIFFFTSSVNFFYLFGD